MIHYPLSNKKTVTFWSSRVVHVKYYHHFSSINVPRVLYCFNNNNNNNKFNNRNALKYNSSAYQFRQFSSASSPKRDYYEVLGVEKTAPVADIKKKYFALAKKYHPDQNKSPEAQKKFQEASEAWEVLSDEERRKNYDQFGHAAEQQGFGGPGGAGPNGFDQQQANDLFNRVVRDLFGQGGGGGFGGFGGFEDSIRRDGSTRGQDVGVAVNVSFAEAVKGGTKEVSFTSLGQCGTCAGTGAKNKKPDLQKCKRCNGRGVMMRSVGGFMQVQQTCDSCGGSGNTLKNPCSSCDGRGTSPTSTTLTVTIPKGVDNGMSMRIPGKGNVGERNGGQGDLIVQFRVEESKKFERDGANINSEVEVSITQALLGGSTTVSGLEGELEVKIPANVLHGQVMRLKNKGFSKVDGRGVGDHFLHFVYKMPTSLTPKQKELLKEFEAEEEKKKSTNATTTKSTGDNKNNNNSTNESIFSKIKNTITGAATTSGKE